MPTLRASKPRLKAPKPPPFYPLNNIPRHLPRFGALRFVRTVAECCHHANAIFARVDYTNAGFRFLGLTVIFVFSAKAKSIAIAV